MRYIEFRVYIRDDAQKHEVDSAALELQDFIGDMLTDTEAPEIFTQNVTFEVVDNREKD